MKSRKTCHEIVPVDSKVRLITWSLCL